MDSSLPPSPAEASDIFSLSDQVLSDRLRFVEEVIAASSALSCVRELSLMNVDIALDRLWQLGLCLVMPTKEQPGVLFRRRLHKTTGYEGSCQTCAPLKDGSLHCTCTIIVRIPPAVLPAYRGL